MQFYKKLWTEALLTTVRPEVAGGLAATFYFGRTSADMSHYYTVRQTASGTDTEVVRVHDNSSPEESKVTIVETVVETDENGEALVNSSERVISAGGGGGVSGRSSLQTASTGGSAVDTAQLMGMASTLPSSNIFVNYPHTMWERDSEGNRIPVTVPVTVVKAEDDRADPDDLLGHATGIKTEQEDTTSVTTITIPASATHSSSQVVLTPSSSAVISAVGGGGSSAARRIVVAKPEGNGEPVPRPHVCDVCNKTFAKREHLTKHLRIHKSDNKRYSCEYCQKAFRDRYELVRHTRRHTGDFPFR